MEEGAASIQKHFGKIGDRRSRFGKRHKLIDIIVIAICAVICGADDWVSVEEYGKAKQSWLKGFLELPNGIPAHDTFGRVFALIEPEEFGACFLKWVRAVMNITKGGVIAIDGKTARGSGDPESGKSAIHMVSAWAHKNNLVLGQVKVDEKSNEIPAIPELLQVLAINGCIVTIDAMGCQKEIAKKIIQRGADYVLALKENHERLYEEVKETFELAQAGGFGNPKPDYWRTVNKNHGRIEIRKCWVISETEDLAYLQENGPWVGLQSIVMVQAERHMGEQSTQETRYYLSSLKGKAKALLSAVRNHWGIENSLHWVLDVAFQEDRCRVRKDHGPENFVVLRHIALNLLKQEKTAKVGIKNKRLICAWNNDYLLKVLDP